MKTLILIRHAKSDWSNPSLKDFDRPLNKRGLRDAPKMGKLLKKKNLLPDKVYVSTAVRTIDTLRLIGIELELSFEDIVREEKIYEADVSTLLTIIEGFSDQDQCIYLIGHNPGMTYLTNYLTGELVDNVPTCGVVKIDFEIENWEMVSKGLGKLKNHYFPKELDF